MSITIQVGTKVSHRILNKTGAVVDTYHGIIEIELENEGGVPMVDKVNNAAFAEHYIILSEPEVASPKSPAIAESAPAASAPSCVAGSSSLGATGATSVADDIAAANVDASKSDLG